MVESQLSGSGPTSDQLFTSTSDPSHTGYATYQNGTWVMAVSSGLVVALNGPTITSSMEWKYTAAAGAFQLLADPTKFLTMAIDGNGQPEIGSQLYAASPLPHRAIALYSLPYYGGDEHVLNNGRLDLVVHNALSVRLAPDTYAKLYNQPAFQGKELTINFDVSKLPEGFVIKSFQLFDKVGHAHEPHHEGHEIKHHCEHEEHEKGKHHEEHEKGKHHEEHEKGKHHEEHEKGKHHEEHEKGKHHEEHEKGKHHEEHE